MLHRHLVGFAAKLQLLAEDSASALAVAEDSASALLVGFAAKLQLLAEDSASALAPAAAGAGFCVGTCGGRGFCVGTCGVCCEAAARTAAGTGFSVLTSTAALDTGFCTCGVCCDERAGIEAAGLGPAGMGGSGFCDAKRLLAGLMLRSSGLGFTGDLCELP